jgi:hypothetical protein
MGSALFSSKGNNPQINYPLKYCRGNFLSNTTIKESWKGKERK